MAGFIIWSHKILLLTVILILVDSVDSKNDTDQEITRNYTTNERLNRLVIVTVVLFSVMFLILCIQCILILRLMRQRGRSGDLELNSNENEFYSRISQAEFTTSLGENVERNNSIGSSSLNFLSPDLTQSVSSLCNVCSLDGESSSSQTDIKRCRFMGTERPSRKDTVVYAEIRNQTRKGDGSRKVSELSNQSSPYAMIKGPLDVVGEALGSCSRPVTYCEIPGAKFLKSGLLGKEKITEEIDTSGESVSVTAEVYSSPMGGKGLLSDSVTDGSITNSPREVSAIYLDVFADQDDYDEYAEMRGTIQPVDSFRECSENKSIDVGEPIITEDHSTYLEIFDSNDGNIETVKTTDEQALVGRVASPGIRYNTGSYEVSKDSKDKSSDNSAGVFSPYLDMSDLHGEVTGRLTDFHTNEVNKHTDHVNEKEESVGYLIKIQNDQTIDGWKEKRHTGTLGGKNEACLITD